MHSRIIDVMKEIETAKNHIEKGAPLCKVVRLHVKGVRDKRFDVHTMDRVRDWNSSSHSGGRT
jgi:hypothetical protein